MDLEGGRGFSFPGRNSVQYRLYIYVTDIYICDEGTTVEACGSKF